MTWLWSQGYSPLLNILLEHKIQVVV